MCVCVCVCVHVLFFSFLSWQLKAKEKQNQEIKEEKEKKLTKVIFFFKDAQQSSKCHANFFFVIVFHWFLLFSVILS